MAALAWCMFHVGNLCFSIKAAGKATGIIDKDGAAAHSFKKKRPEVKP